MIHVWKNNAGTMELSKADLELFSLIKLRVDNKCNICQKEIKKGCYALGKGYHKYCLDCAPKLIDNAVNSMKNYIQTLRQLRNILQKNLPEYMRNNVASSL